MTFGDTWRSILTLPDKILFFCLLFAGLSSYSLLPLVAPAGKTLTAVVDVAGKEAGHFSLDPGLPQRTIPVTIEGGTAFFEISGGKIRLLPMPDRLCSRHICSRKGWIGKPWQMIVCLPNRVVVRVLGGNRSSKDGVDLITR